jgi:hypothetical protein
MAETRCDIKVKGNNSGVGKETKRCRSNYNSKPVWDGMVAQGSIPHSEACRGGSPPLRQMCRYVYISRMHAVLVKSCPAYNE